MDARHPSEAQLLAFQADALPVADADAVKEHTSSCETCAARLRAAGGEQVTRTVAAPPPLAEERVIAPGTRVGRFLVTGTLGKGGTGVVYAARDPELNREVALKVLRLDRGNLATQQDGSALLLREAQAMARLSHPNVVAVHEVGTYQDSLFVAMERVDGATLKAWLRERPRSWREIVSVFTQSGRGLAAAHASGVIHRDFKPDNVLVDKAGRARVTDFGLARVLGEADIREPSSPSWSPDAHGSSASGGGHVVGTLAYMAPEQLRGEALDARTDEFSYCVALYEALFNQRPFSRSGVDLQPQPLPKSGVPGWIRRPLMKGLSLAPANRFASMPELLEALAADPGPRRRRTAAVGGGLAFAALTAFLAVRWLSPPDPCAAPGQLLVGVWDDGVRRTLAAAFRAASAPGAADRWSYAEHALDRAAARWTEAMEEVCSARAQHRESESGAHLRIECLLRQRDDLQVVTDVLSKPSPSLIESSVRAVQVVKSPAECRDARVLPVIPPADPQHAEAARALRARNVRASMLGSMGNTAEAMRERKAILAEAERLGDPPLLVDILNDMGVDLGRAGNHQESVAYYQRALDLADREHLDAVVARVTTGVAQELAMMDSPRAKVEAALDAARRAVLRAGDTATVRWPLESAFGAALFLRGDVQGALPHYLTAEKLVEELEGPDSLTLIVPLNNVGSAQMDQGLNSEAIETWKRVVSLSERLVGPNRDTVRIVWTNLAFAYETLGRPAEAREAAAHAMQQPENSYSVLSRGALAHALVDEGHVPEALAEAERALALASSVGMERTNEGNLLRQSCATVFLVAGETARAKALHEEVLAWTRAHVEANSVDWVDVLRFSGELDLAQGNPARARDELEQALAHTEGHPFTPGTVSEVRFRLAQAIVASHGDRARAARLAQAAEEDFARLPFQKKFYDEIVAWRSKHLTH